MSKIVNEPKNTFPLFVKVREQLEHRALWLYLLVDEARKHGLPDDAFAADAVKGCTRAPRSLKRAARRA